MTSMLSRSLPLLALLTLAACKTSVIGGGGGGGAGGGGGGEGGVGGQVGVGPTTAIAEYAYMLAQPPDPGTGTTSSSSGGTGVDPNTLYVRIGNYGPVCGGTFPYNCTPQTTWQVSIGIPPAMQAPGVYMLADPALISMASVSGGSGGGECWGGGGSFVEGTLEIVSNDGGTIVVRLAGTTGGGFSEFAADGDYAAPICQWGLD